MTRTVQRVQFAVAWIKALIAFAIVERFGVGNRVDSWRWRLLPSYGDWIYRKDEGRLSSLACFVELREWHRNLATLPLGQIEGEIAA
jgi:hypothetical protein